LRSMFLPYFLVLGLLAVPLMGQEKSPIIDYKSRFHPVIGTRGMVASQEAEASKIGLEVLRNGGNAVDAAVAIGYALAVTLPKAGNLGGGGFMVVHLAGEKRTVALDFREMAPAAAKRDMFLDKNGQVDNNKARFSYHSAGVPGTVAGFSYALEKYGTQPLGKLIAPAIVLARDGVLVSHSLAADLKGLSKRKSACEATRAIFFKPDGSTFGPGERLRNPDLAWSLEQIARSGAAAFYKGEIASRIEADMKANGGLITRADLASYQVREMEPVWGKYRGYDVASMPPPSSGGVHVIQMLNILEGYPIGKLGHNSASSIHLLAEAMKLAYADRSKYLGDPDFFKVPLAGLTSKPYAESLRQTISRERASTSDKIGPANPLPYESPQTTHFSVMDANGNAVAVTYTLNFSFGSGLVAAGTGILLNNEMDDFSAKPGTPNAFGLLGGEANAIQARKRPLSSMTPTLVFKDGKVWLVTGSPGGSTIITAVLQMIMNVVDHDLNVAEATAAPRIHHQWYPDMLRLERGISKDTILLLEIMGHKVETRNAMGSTQSIMAIDGLLLGASDPRRQDALTLGY